MREPATHTTTTIRSHGSDPSNLGVGDDRYRPTGDGFAGRRLDEVQVHEVGRHRGCARADRGRRDVRRDGRPASERAGQRLDAQACSPHCTFDGYDQSLQDAPASATRRCRGSASASASRAPRSPDTSGIASSPATRTRKPKAKPRSWSSPRWARTSTEPLRRCDSDEDAHAHRRVRRPARRGRMLLAGSQQPAVRVAATAPRRSVPGRLRLPVGRVRHVRRRRDGADRRARWSGSASCPDEPVEPNNSYTAPFATPVAASSRTGSSPGLRSARQATSTYYALTTNAMQTLTATITYNACGRSLDMQLLDSNGMTMKNGTAMEGMTNVVSASVADLPANATYYVFVQGSMTGDTQRLLARSQRFAVTRPSCRSWPFMALGMDLPYDFVVSRIGELLVREKMLSLQQLQQAQDEAKRTGKRLGATLARLGYVNDQALTQFVAKQYSLPSINLGRDRDRHGGVEARAARDLREASGHPGSPQRADADRRDGRSVEHLRDRRAQVPHAVQHRAGRRVRGQRRGSAVALLRQGARPRPDGRRARRRQRRLRERVRRRGQRRRSREPGRRGAGRQAVQRDLALGDQEEGVGYPRRAVREELPRAVPHRRHLCKRRCDRR